MGFIQHIQHIATGLAEVGIAAEIHILGRLIIILGLEMQQLLHILRREIGDAVSLPLVDLLLRNLTTEGNILLRLQHSLGSNNGSLGNLLGFKVKILDAVTLQSTGIVTLALLEHLHRKLTDHIDG